MTAYTVRDAKIEDAQRILEIYAYYVENTAITFEYDVPSKEEFKPVSYTHLDVYKRQDYNINSTKVKCFLLKNIDSTKMNCYYNTHHNRSEMN